MTPCDPVLGFPGDECTCVPRRESRFRYALHGDPLALSAERWSQAACSDSPERLEREVWRGLEFKVWGVAGGMICQADMQQSKGF